MPDYAEQAMKDGWYQEGSKWKKKGVDKVYYNALQIWDECLPDRLKRPLSANDLAKPGAPVSPPPVPEVTISQQLEAQKPIPQKRTLKGYKRDVDGLLVPKDE